MKPDAPDTIRGEFKPIATRTPGIQICEHLPMLAQRSHLWALVRSMAHPYPAHSDGHLLMLTGRSRLPPGFDALKPRPTDWPSIAAVAGAVCPPRNDVPPAVVLPEVLVHREGRTIPGQFAGEMGAHRNPMFVNYSRFNALTYGAWPQYGFHHAAAPKTPRALPSRPPTFRSPAGWTPGRFNQRLDLLNAIGHQQVSLQRAAETSRSIAIDSGPFRSWPIARRSKPSTWPARTPTLDRYGRNTFGWSLLIARQLVEAGVTLVQVNLGNNETWDTHGNAFPH